MTLDDLWILDEHGEPTRAGTLDAWVAWRDRAYESGEYRVGETIVGPLTVSTIFLSLDASHGHYASAPVLYETMIFGGPDDLAYSERYTTRALAERGHAEAVRVAELHVRLHMRPEGV